MPEHRLSADSPIEVVEARALFRSEAVSQRGFASLARLPSGRLLFAFRLGPGPVRTNNGVVMLARSDDDGRSWSEPRPLFAWPGWDGLLMGGLACLPDGLIRLIFGRVVLDFSLGGPEPLTGWHVYATESRDGGERWSEPGLEIDLFPCWTELYGASNPHPLADGRFLWAGMGTLGRDAGWQAGVTVTGPSGDDFSPPVIIAAGEGKEYADIDVVRLADGRLLAVIREMAAKESVWAVSADDGATWSPVRPTGFKGANIKLHRLRSGAVLCLYRDEDPDRPGVSCSVSEDGGERWRFVGQLYAAGSDVTDVPGCLCGYPDLVALDERELLCVLHTYPDRDGRADLHQFRLIDRT